MQGFKPAMIAIDLDGTLVDSVPDLHAAIVRMQQAVFVSSDTQQGYAMATTEDVRGWVGDGIERLIHRSLTSDLSAEAPEDLFKQGLNTFKLAYRETNGQCSSVYPNVISVLRWLREQQYPLCCITNKSREFAVSLLKIHHLSGYFDYVLGGDDVSRKKPHPEALLKACRYFGVEPTQSLMVGDSVADIKAADAAGYQFVGVSYGYDASNSMADISDQNAVIDDFSELKILL